MKQFAVIGNPIEHSLSPDLHNYVYKLLSINALYKKVYPVEIMEKYLPEHVDNGFMEIVPFDETGAPNSFNIISE